ncbi:asparagine synthase-related protein [Bacillus thermotolerans]|uniref:asparagine synthase-related protein n=1 Tax=Bacillus thermotolerans TaxID=1221996 RepID=UPI00059234E6|nr:asparagine synthase-related protein [Bacillus thermotolerans]KKB45030.1 Asparagine synthetase [Bacillus thermotolerans]
MSDFIYSRDLMKKGVLTEQIRAIYCVNSPSVMEFHGEWGSLAVSRNLYNGFDPYETDEHICIVLGGPVLCFRDNRFLQGSEGSIGTEAIYNQWLEGNMKWDEDLSGPYSILIINKRTLEINCITDLMSFIPIYVHRTNTNIALSSHVDILARVSGQQEELDLVSIVDFILHGTITYPYTAYTAIQQVAPASIHTVSIENNEVLTKNYWIPEEKIKYQTVNQAAEALRESVGNYVNDLIVTLPKIAQFISGGEDSRVLSGLLTRKYNRDAFVFLDQMNREGKVAKKAADVYNAKFHITTRSKNHYLKILPPCSDLVGQGSQYTHAHTFGFHESCKLNQYSAVFGGLFSDALLKGARIKKMEGAWFFACLPQLKRKGYSPANPVKQDAFKSNILEELTKRRREHLNFIKEFRKESAEEWFELWPSSMNMNIPNLHVNRRLFRSYEPFMSKDVVKIAASVPQNWKLNRRLFNKAFKPLLKPTKWLFHSEGWLPYFPWYINIFIKFPVKVLRKIGGKIGVIRGNQGPWGDWNGIINTSNWNKAIHYYLDGLDVIAPALREKNIKKLFTAQGLNNTQLINLMQVLYSNHKR